MYPTRRCNIGGCDAPDCVYRGQPHSCRKCGAINAHRTADCIKSSHSNSKRTDVPVIMTQVVPGIMTEVVLGSMTQVVPGIMTGEPFIMTLRGPGIITSSGIKLFRR